MNTQQKIIAELKNHFKVLPIKPYEVIVKFDKPEDTVDTKMWIAYQENHKDSKEGYCIAFEPLLSEWHVLEYFNGEYRHVVLGGKNFTDAWKAM